MASVGGGKTKYIYQYDKIVYNSVHVAVAGQQRENNFVFPLYKTHLLRHVELSKADWVLNWFTQNPQKIVFVCTMRRRPTCFISILEDCEFNLQKRINTELKNSMLRFILKNLEFKSGAKKQDC